MNERNVGDGAAISLAECGNDKVTEGVLETDKFSSIHTGGGIDGIDFEIQNQGILDLKIDADSRKSISEV